MNGRSPARLLAPAALVVAAVALFVIVTSGGDSAPERSSTESEATATATPKAKEKNERSAETGSGDTYTVEPGDTPLAIAEKLGVDYAALLEANPEIDATALTVGEELVVP